MSRGLELALSIADAAEMLLQVDNPLNVDDAAEQIYSSHEPTDYSVFEIKQALEDQMDRSGSRDPSLWT